MPTLSGSELSLLRTHPHKFKEYLAVLQPNTILACRLNGAPSGDPVISITYDNVSEGSYGDVVPGMTLWVGSSAGSHDKGACRIRKAATADTLYIAEDSAIDWEDDDYLTVVENYELWAKYPRIIVSGDTITFYKDWDEAYSDQHENWPPVTIMGPPDCQFLDSGVATCKFVGEHSYAVAPGASITGYSWSFPGGTPSTSSSAGTVVNPIEVTWDTPGTYWVSLTVTDSNGKSHTGRRPIFIFERTGTNAPYSRFRMSGRQGDLNQHGHTANFEIHGDADQAEFPDGALVVYFTEDWYGNTKQSIGGNYSYREHIKFVGYIQRESTIKDPQTSVVRFEAATINALMATREGFSCWIKTVGNASNWTEATNLTADRASLSLCRHNSTLLDICDVIVSGDDHYIKSQEFAAKTSLFQQLQTLYDDLFAHVACDKQGRLYFEIDPQMKAVEDRSADIIVDLQHGDWRDRIDLPRPQEKTTSFINLSGVYYQGYPHDVMPILSKAPGDAPAYHGGRTTEISGLILGGQSDGNLKAGLALARDNNEFPEVTIPMAGLWDVFDIVPQEYVRLSLSATDTNRGIIWTNQKLIPRRVELEVAETEMGRVPKVVIHVEKDSYGPAGVDGDYPDEVPPVSGDGGGITLPPSPSPVPGPGEGDGHLLYFIDRTTGHLFRTRNARASNPADVVYEDLGFVGANLRCIVLDPWEPRNRALVVGDRGAWLTSNLDAITAWTQVITTSSEYTLLHGGASICQQGLWGVVGHRAAGSGESMLYMWRTLDGWESFQHLQLRSDDASTGAVEFSSHDPGYAWVTFHDSNWLAIMKSTNVNQTTPTWNRIRIGASIGGGNTVPSYHRFLDNIDDGIALCGDAIDGVARVFYSIDDYATGATSGYPTAGPSATQMIWGLGGYTWGSAKYWVLTYGTGVGYRFHVSDDGVSWTLQHTFSGSVRFISGWPYDGERFYACQDGPIAPILISDDRGLSWQAQTGNWASLGYSGDIQQCVPVWVE